MVIVWVKKTTGDCALQSGKSKPESWCQGPVLQDLELKQEPEVVRAASSEDGWLIWHSGLRQRVEV